MSNTQRDNSDETAKLLVRRWLWERMPEHRVLDLYCGKDGRMWQGIWQEADLYLGCDKFRPHRLATTLKMSAERAVQSLNLDEWTIFDIDTYSSPWVIARRILRRRGRGVFGLCLTNGEDRGLRGSANEIVRRSIGASGLSDYRLLWRYKEMVIGLMLRSLGDIPGIQLRKGVKIIGGHNNTMIYISLLVDKSQTGGRTASNIVPAHQSSP